MIGHSDSVIFGFLFMPPAYHKDGVGTIRDRGTSPPDG